jgi:hypothetical protein
MKFWLKKFRIKQFILKQRILNLSVGFFFRKTKPKNQFRIIPNQKNNLFWTKRFFGFGNLFIPDARVKTIGCLFEKYILDNDIDTIITSGPPHSLQLD